LGMPGTFTVKAGDHNFVGPASQEAELPKFEVGDTQRRFVITHLDGKSPIANLPYAIAMTNGDILKGVTDATGATELLAKDAMHIADIKIEAPKTDAAS